MEGKQEHYVDCDIDETFAADSIDGLRCNETVYIFKKSQLDTIKEKSTVPFYVCPWGKKGFVLFASTCNVVTELGKIILTDTYLLAKRYVKKQEGISKLMLELVENDVEHFCFDKYKNYEE